MDGQIHTLLEAGLERLKGFERESIERLTRLDENLRLLRHDLLGDGQPGRIPRIEAEVSQIQAEVHRQRGIFAAISFLVSSATVLVSRFLHR